MADIASLTLSVDAKTNELNTYLEKLK